MDFEEPAADACPCIAISVRNADAVTVRLEVEGAPRWGGVTLSYWQLERICKRVREEFAFQLDREQAGAPITPREMLTLAATLERDLVEGECNFSHPEWRYVEGLRELARSTPKGQSSE